MAALSSSTCNLEISTVGEPVSLSGVSATKTGSLTPFDELDVSSNVKVDFVIGNEFGYAFTADTAVINRYYLTMENNEFKVGIKNGIALRWNDSAFSKPELKITVPGYDAFKKLDVEISGATEITIPAFNVENLGIEAVGASNAVVSGAKISGNLSLDAVGASTVKVHNIEVLDIEVDCSGASTVYIDGKTNKLDIDCVGASKVYAEELVVKEYANVDCVGASSVSVGDLTGATVDLDASGASSIHYSGDPNINSSDASGASRIKKQ